MNALTMSATRRRKQVVNIARMADVVANKIALPVACVAAVVAAASGIVHSVTPGRTAAITLAASSIIAIVALMTSILAPQTEKGGVA